MMPAGEVVAIVGDLVGRGVDVRLSGGWAVDALLGEQSREHSDLDLWVPTAHTEPLLATLAARGIDRVLPRPGDRPWNFVLHDGGEIVVDLHLYEPLPDGAIHYGSVTSGLRFPARALDGHGVVAGMPVRCESAEWSVAWHTGYETRSQDRHDVTRLCGRFAIPLPPGF
jgi:lincosamide nucleotidyltransferase A/C/D/E